MANQVNSSTFKKNQSQKKKNPWIPLVVKLFYVRCNQCGISDTAGNRTDRINYGRVKQQSTKANKKEKFLKSEISP